MPYRTTPISPPNYYHVYNRSVAQETIFKTNADYQRIIDIFSYYRFQKPPIKYSIYNRLLPVAKQEALKRLKELPQLVEISAYCIMPNHFHLLVKESIQGGISTFLRNSQNSYAKYFNIKRKRSGALFQSMFKCVVMESDEVILHVARYIHLNPFTGNIVQSEHALPDFPWSSYPSYIYNLEEPLLTKTFLLSQFPSIEAFKKFTLDNAHYQQTLADIRHALNEK